MPWLVWLWGRAGVRAFLMTRMTSMSWMTFWIVVEDELAVTAVMVGTVGSRCVRGRMGGGW